MGEEGERRERVRKGGGGKEIRGRFGKLEGRSRGREGRGVPGQARAVCGEVTGTAGHTRSVPAGVVGLESVHITVYSLPILVMM